MKNYSVCSVDKHGEEHEVWKGEAESGEAALGEYARDYSHGRYATIQEHAADLHESYDGDQGTVSEMDEEGETVSVSYSWMVRDEDGVLEHHLTETLKSQTGQDG